MTGFSRLAPLILGTLLGVGAYVALGQSQILDRIDPERIPTGREYNDSIAIKEARRVVEDPDAQVLYIIGGSTALEGIDEKVVAFLLSERLGETVRVVNLATTLQTLTDSHALLSALPPGRPGRSHILYTWVGLRLQKNLAKQIREVLTHQGLPLGSPLIEAYRDRLQRENTGFFYRTTVARHEESCEGLGLRERSRRRACFLPTAGQVASYIKAPGRARTAGSRAVHAFSIIERRNLRSQTTRRPVSDAAIETARTAYAAALAEHGPDPEHVATLDQQLTLIETIWNLPPPDVERHAAFLLHSVETARSRGYDLMLYELGMWPGALESEIALRTRDTGRRIVELATAAGRAAWIGRDRGRSAVEPWHYRDLLHTTDYGKLLRSIEIAADVGAYLARKAPGGD